MVLYHPERHIKLDQYYTESTNQRYCTHIRTVPGSRYGPDTTFNVTLWQFSSVRTDYRCAGKRSWIVGIKIPGAGASPSLLTVVLSSTSITLMTSSPERLTPANIVTVAERLDDWRGRNSAIEMQTELLYSIVLPFIFIFIFIYLPLDLYRYGISHNST